jgi:hypothetical protein
VRAWTGFGCGFVSAAVVGGISGNRRIVMLVQESVENFPYNHTAAELKLAARVEKGWKEFEIEK